MKHILYILLCDQKTFYIGITENIEKRVKDHTTGQSFFTKKFSDIKLVYQEQYLDKETAANRERQLKGWSIAKKKALIEGEINQLKKLSKARSVSKFSHG